MWLSEKREFFFLAELSHEVNILRECRRYHKFHVNDCKVNIKKATKAYHRLGNYIV